MSQTTEQWLRSLVGTRIGKYQIGSFLDRGGMAAVFTAWHPDLQQEVILKILLPAYAQDPTVVRRFREEARQASRLTHPNIIRLFDAGQADGKYYIAMEYVRGFSLKALLERHVGQPMDLRQVQSIVDQVSSALDYAHARDIVHRDVKPGNIMITQDGRAILTDFGIALARQATRLTADHMTVGTADYMSPEQARGADVGQQSDIYSLGIVLYEMLAGRPPYRGDTPYAVVHKHIYEPLPPLKGVAKPVADVVRKAAHKDPSKRFASAGDLARALQQARRGVAPPQSNRVWIWLAVAAAVALLVVGVLLVATIYSPGEVRTITRVVTSLPTRVVTSLPTRVVTSLPTRVVTPAPAPGAETTAESETFHVTLLVATPSAELVQDLVRRPDPAPTPTPDF